MPPDTAKEVPGNTVLAVDRAAKGFMHCTLLTRQSASVSNVSIQ